MAITAAAAAIATPASDFDGCRMGDFPPATEL
jgi:hypothetical protein